MEPEEVNVVGRLELIDQKLDHMHDNLCKRTKFLEKIVFGFIGMIVVGVLVTLGGIMIWALGLMKGAIAMLGYLKP